MVGHPSTVITGVIVHLANDLPIVVDMDELPNAGDRMIRCTNVRTVDGKRPAFVHERGSTFIFPLEMVRLIEITLISEDTALTMQEDYEARASSTTGQAFDEVDEAAEQDLLARIRQI